MDTVSMQDFQVRSPGDQRQKVLTPLIDAYKRRYRRAVDARFEGSAQRMEAHYYWDGFRQDLRNLQESAEHLSAWPSAQKSGATVKKPKAQLRKLHTKIRTDLDTLNTKMETVEQLMEALRVRDRRTERAERALDNSSRALISAIQRSDVVQNDIHGDEDLSDISLAPSSNFGSEALVPTSPPMAPQLLQFYNAVSNYKIMRERLFDLDVERQEQWERRLLLADQDQILEQTDDQFTAMWQETFLGPESDFRDARTTLQQARELCLDANIAIPALQDLQIPDAEGDEQPHSVSQEEPSTNLSSHQSIRAADIPNVTLNRPSSQHELPPQSSDTVADPLPLEFAQMEELDDSSPSSPLAVNGRLAERVFEWIDHTIDLNAVNQSLGDHNPLPQHESSNVIASVGGNYSCMTQPPRSTHSPIVPYNGVSRRTRASSLPLTFRPQPGNIFDRTDGGVQATWKPP